MQSYNLCIVKFLQGFIQPEIFGEHIAKNTLWVNLHTVTNSTQKDITQELGQSRNNL